MDYALDLALFPPYALHFKKKVGADNFMDTRLGCYLMPAVAVLILCNRIKNMRPSRGIFNLSLFLRKGGTVFEALACCVSILPGTDNKATLLYFLQTVSPYFCLASVDRESRF